MAATRLRWMAVSAAAAVVWSGLAVSPLPESEPAAAAPPAAVDGDVSVPGRDVPVTGEEPAAAEESTVVTHPGDRAPVWPSAGTAVVDVPVATGRALPGEVAVRGPSGVSVLADGASAAALRLGSREPSKAGPGPVSRTEAPPATVGGLAEGGVSQVRVVAKPRRVAEQLGAAQVFTLARTDGDSAGAAVDVRVDYSGYADAFGGNYADRLRLVRLPVCALTTPEEPECGAAPRPVQAVNNPTDVSLTARLPVSGAVSANERLLARMGEKTARSGTVFAVVSSGSGTSTGDYEATDLGPGGTWQVGLSSGAFTYSYPVPEPPLLAGDGLGLSLGYNSQSIDAFNQTTNNQAGWVGLGWDLSPGYIERRFRSCSEDIDDGSPKERSDQQYWGNLCWESPDENDGEGDTTDYSHSELYLSLNGKSTRIVNDHETGEWRTEQDFGWDLELISGGDGQDYWRVSTQCHVA